MANHKSSKFIRNFCIIAHVDHGKSTLADCLLTLTNTIPEREMKAQVLDNLELERQRGITIKLNAVNMTYHHTDDNDYFLNLIDTPGHADFNYEVSRSLAACEGALLVVDASQGVQAQTLSTAYNALEADLTIIPVLNKIDLATARPDEIKQEIYNIVGIDAANAPLVSAKNCKNIDQIFAAIINKIPPPPAGNYDLPLKALVFDSYYDVYRGAILSVRIMEGQVNKGDHLLMMSNQKTYQITALGIKTNHEIDLQSLAAGDVGWIAAGIKKISDINVGDTITLKDNPTSLPLPGYQKIKPFVYCGLFPINPLEYKKLKEALHKIALTDAALVFGPESSEALGYGFRCGFLGVLHMEVVQERLEKEHNLELIAAAPSTLYRVTLTTNEVIEISRPSDLPEPTRIKYIEEPWVLMKIYSSEKYIGNIMQLCQNKRGNHQELKPIGKQRFLLVYLMPFSEIIYDFFDQLKSISQGYASFDYEFDHFQQAKLVKLDILLNGDLISALSSIVFRPQAEMKGRALCLKLKDLLPAQNFEIPIQAIINRKIIARETVKARRKNVTAGLYGGDVSRKKKVLAKQKKGKKRLKQVGKIQLSQESFLAILKT